MKEFKVFLKNIKILMRSKSSAFVILLAPLLIVIIIGTGFHQENQTGITIGTFVPQQNELSQRYINNLQESNTTIKEYQDQKSCENAIKTNEILACIVFPEDLEIRDGNQNIFKIYVDESRMNLVYQIISSLSTKFQTENKEISREFTNQLLTILSQVNKINNENINTINTLEKQTEKTKNNLNSTTNTLKSVDDEDIKINIMMLADNIGDIEREFSNLRNKAKKTLEASIKIIEKEEYNGTEIDELQSTLNSLESSINNSQQAIDQMRILQRQLETASENVKEIRNKLSESRTIRIQSIEDLERLQMEINENINQIKVLKENMNQIQTKISSFKLSDAESIVSPIDTEINPVTTHDKVTYSFPYLLQMVILFVGIMLSGMLIFMEKDSKAYLRTYTTPLKHSFFRNMNFITALIILLFQTFLILLFVNILLNVPLMPNIFLTFATIILSTTFFILLGMLIGYIFSTNEAIMMSSIALGSIMIFFSNLILPLETLSQTVRNITKFNPYVLGSEAIRKTVLFNAGITELKFEFITLATFSLTLIIIILVINKYNSPIYKLQKTKKTKNIVAPVDKYLYIPEKNIIVRDIVSLLDALRTLNDSEYILLELKEHKISDWLYKIYKDKKLKRKIKNKNRSSAIKLLLKYLND